MTPSVSVRWPVGNQEGRGCDQGWGQSFHRAEGTPTPGRGSNPEAASQPPFFPPGSGTPPRIIITPSGKLALNPPFEKPLPFVSVCRPAGDPICFVENASGGVVDTKLKGRPVGARILWETTTGGGGVGVLRNFKKKQLHKEGGVTPNTPLSRPRGGGPTNPPLRPRPTTHFSDGICSAKKSPERGWGGGDPDPPRRIERGDPPAPPSPCLRPHQSPLSQDRVCVCVPVSLCRLDYSGTRHPRGGGGGGGVRLSFALNAGKCSYTLLMIYLIFIP